jgi:predicted HTH domain antitoxin
MIKWDKEGEHARALALYSMGRISLHQLAKEIELTTLETMELLASAGYMSEYSFEDFIERQKLLDEYLDYQPGEQ